MSLSDYIVTQDYDIVAITETWLGTSVDKKCIAELVSSGYSMKHVLHPDSRKGGGVALLYKSTISFRLLGSSTTANYTNFEHMDCVLNTAEMTVRLAVVNRPHCQKIIARPSLTPWTSTFLVKYTTHNNEIIIVGDLNFHVNVKNNRDTQRFMNTIKACGLQQHAHEPTHVLGHTLDVVISRDISHIISDVTIINPGQTWSHAKIVSYRKLRAIDVETLKHAIVLSSMLQTTHKLRKVM